MLTDHEVAAIAARAAGATPGPWEWRAGVHTGDPATSDAGGIHTATPVERTMPDGRVFMNDNVVFPIGRIGGDPYWLERLRTRPGNGRPALTMSLELFAADADQAFILAARVDVPALLADRAELVVELTRLRAHSRPQGR